MVLAACCAFALAALLFYQVEAGRLLQKKIWASSIADEYAHSIERQLNVTISATYTLATLLQNSHGETEHFEQTADEILAYHKGVIRNLQLAPNGVVGRIHPLAGHEKAIGHDLFKDPKRREDALRAVRTRELTLAGPVNLVQGGNGMIARLPVFLGARNQQKERFWGFVSALILTDNLLAASNLSQLDGRGFLYELVKPADDKLMRLAGNASHALDQPVSVRVGVPNGAWQLNIAPREGWLNLPLLALEGLAALAAALLAGKLAATLFRQIALQRELERANATLEQRVRDEVGANRQKEMLLMQQSRMAAMGEMVGNIAHQWRQPLNALNILLANLKDAHEHQELDQETLDELVAHARRLTGRMSDTIEDFRNFFKPMKEKSAFRLRDSLDGTLSLMGASLKGHGITLDLTGGEDAMAYGYANEFSQVLLNLITNAKEAIAGANVKDGKIEVELGNDDKAAWAIVRDNGGGIPEDILPRIFEPYFTTKEKGTGIGLYMSRMIMEHMDGSIAVSNDSRGAVFRLSLPRPRQDAPPTA